VLQNPLCRHSIGGYDANGGGALVMAAGDKLGELSLRRVGSRIHAYYTLTDGKPQYLCSVAQSTYQRHAHVRALFIELATELMLNLERAAGHGVCVRVREPMPAPFRYPQPFPDERIHAEVDKNERGHLSTTPSVASS
jgi:hypothetical protein